MLGRLSRWVAVAASVGSLGVLAPAAGSSPATLPTLYVMYTTSCTFTFANDSGQTVTTIPPGNYEVDVRTPVAFGTVPLSLKGPDDMTDCRGMAQFQLTGPGVSLTTTVTGGCMADSVQTATFQPGATYVALDGNQPTATRSVLTVATSGSPTAPAAPGSSGSGGSQSVDIVGSAAASLRGKLVATVAASGRITLTKLGKPVATVKAGRYALTIVDHDASGGLTLRSAAGKTPAVTGAKFIGTRSIVVRLVPGRWTYFSGLGATHTLKVVA